ncbi:MAG: hypothetical protein ACREMA_05040 [Longimicrobiales bacterium]
MMVAEARRRPAAVVLVSAMLMRNVPRRATGRLPVLSSTTRPASTFPRAWITACGFLCDGRLQRRQAEQSSNTRQALFRVQHVIPPLVDYASIV